MNQSAPTESHEVCPECGSQRLTRGRSATGFVAGALLVLIGFLGFLWTLGLSFVLALWGVFLMVPHTKCRACGWKMRG